jgi:hypothetical protein
LLSQAVVMKQDANNATIIKRYFTDINSHFFYRLA